MNGKVRTPRSDAFLSATKGALTQFGSELLNSDANVKPKGKRRIRRENTIELKDVSSMDPSTFSLPRRAKGGMRRDVPTKSLLYDSDNKNRLPAPMRGQRSALKSAAKIREEFSIPSGEETAGERPRIIWNEATSEKLGLLQAPHGMNPITWHKKKDPLPGYEISDTHRNGRKHFHPESSSTSSPRENSTVIVGGVNRKLSNYDREGPNKFYYSTYDNVERRDRISREGLRKGAKSSSVLGIGRADAPSWGVRDNFDKSLYLTPSSTESTMSRSASNNAASYKVTPDWWCE